MSLDTQNQSQLHTARQVQLDKSQLFISDFLCNLSSEHHYQLNCCPTCGNSHETVLFQKNGGDYAYCNNCTHIFLKKSLIPEKLIQFYTEYPTSSLDWHKNESEFYRKIYNHGLDSLQNSFRSGTLLDVGCSSGYFLSIAQERDFTTYGVEPNELEADYAIQNNINIIGKTIDDIPDSLKFDVITMWDVLEHISNPVEFIRKLKTYLTDKGVIFVQIPTCDSLAARIMRDKCNMFDGIEHLTSLVPTALISALSKRDLALYSTQVL